MSQLAVISDSGEPLVRDGELMNEIDEWLHLVALGSPRIKDGDEIDPYLSRYALPALIDVTDREKRHSVSNVVVLRYHGYLLPEFVTSLTVALKRLPREHWSAMLVSGFQDEALSILIPALEDQDEEKVFLEWQRPPRR